MEIIKENEKQFRSIFFNAPVAIAVISGPHHTYLMANSDYQKMVSRTEEQLVGKTSKSIFPELVDTGTFEIFDDIYQTGEPFFLAEYPVKLDKNNDGNIHQMYFRFSAVPLKDAEGKFDSIVIVAVDITEQVLARNKIEESETSLRLITDALPVLITYIDKNRTYRFNNKAYETWFGHSSEEIYGKHLQEVLGEAAYIKLKPKIDQVLSGSPVHFELSVPYIDGGTKWVVGDYIPHFGNDNEVLGYYGVVNDVTEQKKAEELNINLASIVQSSTDAIISKTLDGTITSWNSGAEKLFGYVAAEMIGEPITKIIPQDRFEEEPFIIAQITQGKTVDHFETRRHTKSGKLIDISLTISPIKDSEGKVIGASKIARDITDFIEARKKIEESEKQQAFLLMLSDAMRPLHSPFDIEAAVTKIALDFMKADRCHYSTIEGDNVIILQDAARGDLPSVAGVHPLSNFPLYQAVLNAGGVFVVDDVRTNHSLDEDLKKMCLEFRYESFINVPVIKNGKSVGLLSLVQCKPRKWNDDEVQLSLETAERIWTAMERANAEEKIKASEERFRSLAQTLPQLVWVSDAKGNAEFASVKWKEYSGIEPAGEKEWKALVHPDDYDNINATWAQSLTTGHVYTAEVRLKNKDGKYRWYNVIGEPVYDKENKIEKWVGAFTDIHEQKTFSEQLEEKVNERTLQLNEANKNLEEKNIELQKMNKELEAFTYISSHDLQEPLRKIQTFAGRIISKEKEQLSDTTQDYFSRIQNAASRMQLLIQDLLSFSRISTTERKFEVVDLNKIVSDVKEDFKETIETHEASIITDELCEAKIIPFQFRQLMFNLIGNAIKFKKPDVPSRIIIKSKHEKGSELNNEQLLPDAIYCYISVADNGIGFDKKFTEKIFQVFQKLHGNEEYEGTGIGLAIVKKIVDNHNGIITAESELGKGATFNIYLPT